MEPIFLDTNIIIHFLTGDDPAKQAAAKVLFERIENKELTVYAPDTVIGDAVFVLASPRHYHKSRLIFIPPGFIRLRYDRLSVHFNHHASPPTLDASFQIEPSLFLVERKGNQEGGTLLLLTFHADLSAVPLDNFCRNV